MPTATTAKKQTATKASTASKKPTTVVEKVEAPKVGKKVFKDSDGIPCRSIT
jgi:hypothetical protein